MGRVIRTTTTNADGEFWFLDVKPGFYTINEVPSPAVIVMAIAGAGGRGTCRGDLLG